MVIHFKDKEKEYEEWCKEHKNGFVFNNAGGKTGNVLHQVGCRYLNATRYIGTYTTCYPKYCSEKINELSVLADKLSNPFSWRRCKACFTTN